MTGFRFRSTNYFLLPSSCGDGLLAFDAGWPCSLHDYAKALKTTGLRFGHIKWALVSHFHIDHAGLVRDFQDAGITCLVFENQFEAIDTMDELAVRKYPSYRKIQKDKLIRIGTEASRSFLENIGIQAEVTVTPGHSDDSVTLITDNGEALIGDLSPLSQLMPDDLKSHHCYELIRSKGAGNIYPSHAESFSLE